MDYLFNHFGTDKGSKVVDPYSSGSSQIFGHGFSKFYEKKLGPFKDDLFNILEIEPGKVLQLLFKITFHNQMYLELIKILNAR